MRILATTLSAVLAAGVLLAPGAAESRADATVRPAAASVAPAIDGALPTAPGAEDDDAAYARREAESPEVQDFSGGFVIELLVVAVLVLLIVVLAKEI